MAEEHAGPALRFRCHGYGLKSPEQISAFARVNHLLGENFDREPGNEWVREVLRDPELDADRRVAMLLALAELIVEERGA